MPTAFAAEAAFLVAAEGTGGIEFVVGVCPDDAGPQLVHHLENLAAFVGPDAGAQAVRRVVRALDRFFRLRTGPKISSWAIRWEAVTPVKKLGGYQ